MEKISIAIIGGGAAGLFLATSRIAELGKVVVFERGERVGRKLSATGNGQGNVTNRGVCEGGYFSVSQKNMQRVAKMVTQYDATALFSHFENLGVLLFFDERGRAYPTGRQASAVTDALRYRAASLGVELRVGAQVAKLQKEKGGFLLTCQDGAQTFAEQVILCTGGKAAKNFGTDGAGYALAQAFGHTVTQLYPSLVQLKTDTAHIKTLKGIRAADVCVTATWKGGETTLKGDVIFTEYGVSGDAIFRLSAFIADKTDVSLCIDFLPDFSKERIYTLLKQKRNAFPQQAISELLCGIVNNQIGRAILKRVDGDLRQAAQSVKAFSLSVKGSLGFDYAQVTKGGIPLSETDEGLESKLCKGLYFAGEILDVDGECGGYNLQWAFTSANVVAEKILKTRGQV